MQRAAPDLRELIRGVEIHSASAFSIAAERFDVAKTTTAGAGDDLASRLASALYHRRYCRPTRTSLGPTASDARAARVFVEELSQANSGSGAWEPGWIVQGIEADGMVVVRRQRDDLLVWARPNEFRAASGALQIGSAGRLRVAKELREMLQGYYAAFGNADRGTDDGLEPGDVVRFYWHLTAEAACSWMRELTERFNAACIAFHAKVLNDPAAYFRADAGVLYVERKDLGRTLDLLPALHEMTGAGVRPAAPIIAKRHAHGIAEAEDPGDGRSFAQHRCQLIAEGLIRAFERPTGRFETRLKAVMDRFSDQGLSGTTPWLNAGSSDVYHWSPRTPSSPRAGRT